MINFDILKEVIIIYISKKQNNNNDLKYFLIKNATSDLIKKIETKLLNDSKNKNLSEEEEKNFDNFIKNINNFLFEDYQKK